MVEKFKCLRNKIKNETSFEDDASDNQHSTENSFTEVFCSLNTLINIDADANAENKNESESENEAYTDIPTAVISNSTESNRYERKSINTINDRKDSVDSHDLLRRSSFQPSQMSSILQSNPSSSQGQSVSMNMNQSMINSNFYSNGIGSISNILSPINHPLIPRGESEYSTKFDSLE